MVEAALSALGAIVASAGIAAEVLNLCELGGTLEAGKLAEFLVVNRDPLKEITILQDRQKVMVVKGGRIVVDRREEKQQRDGRSCRVTVKFNVRDFGELSGRGCDAFR